jgi:hypothetical protein
MPAGAAAMILFDLRCAGGHEFEGWFRDGAAYERQVAADEVACPICGDTGVSKRLMAPAVARGDTERAGQALKALRAIQRHVERNFENVGQGFAEEARRIHHGEADARNIYGEATTEQAKKLEDEGVPFGVLPRLPQEDA